MVRLVRSSTRKSPRCGAVAVEMAFMLPLLLFIVLSSVEFGRINVIRHSVSNAAYEAARRAIVPGATPADAEVVARQIMGTCGARGVIVDVNPSVIELDTPEVTVTVTVRADENGFLVHKFFNGRILEGVATLRREEI